MNDLGVQVVTQETPDSAPFFFFVFYENNFCIDGASLPGLRGTVNPADKYVVFKWNLCGNN